MKKKNKLINFKIYIMAIDETGKEHEYDLGEGKTKKVTKFKGKPFSYQVKDDKGEFAQHIIGIEGDLSEKYTSILEVEGKEGFTGWLHASNREVTAIKTQHEIRERRRNFLKSL